MENKGNDKFDFIPETVGEEYAELVGRLKAFEAYLKCCVNDSYVRKEVCAAMLGLNLENKA